MIHHVPDANCPHCGHHVDAATDPFDPTNTPYPGDITVCLYCAGICVYTDSMALRSITRTDMDNITPDMKKYLAELQQYIRDNPFNEDVDG